MPAYGMNGGSLQYNPYFQNQGMPAQMSPMLSSMDFARAMYGAGAVQRYRPGPGMNGELEMKAQVGLGFGMGGMQMLQHHQHLHGAKPIAASGAVEQDEWNGPRW